MVDSSTIELLTLGLDNSCWRSYAGSYRMFSCSLTIDAKSNPPSLTTETVSGCCQMSREAKPPPLRTAVEEPSHCLCSYTKSRMRKCNERMRIISRFFHCLSFYRLKPLKTTKLALEFSVQLLRLWLASRQQTEAPPQCGRLFIIRSFMRDQTQILQSMSFLKGKHKYSLFLSIKGTVISIDAHFTLYKWQFN